MKKTPSIILLILIVGNSFGQTKIEGRFCSHDPYNWYCFTLNSDSTFTHSTSSCNGGGESKGVYEIHDKILTLHYESVDTLKNYLTEKITCPPSDSHYFNKYQFSFKKGDKKIYEIKKWKSDEIILKQDKYKFHFWKK